MLDIISIVVTVVSIAVTIVGIYFAEKHTKK